MIAFDPILHITHIYIWSLAPRFSALTWDQGAGAACQYSGRVYLTRTKYVVLAFWGTGSIKSPFLVGVDPRT